MRKGKIENENI